MKLRGRKIYRTIISSLEHWHQWRIFWNNWNTNMLSAKKVRINNVSFWLVQYQSSLFTVNWKSEWFDQMKECSYAKARPADISGIPVNFGGHQNHMAFIPSVSGSHVNCASRRTGSIENPGAWHFHSMNIFYLELSATHHNHRPSRASGVHTDHTWWMVPLCGLSESE